MGFESFRGGFKVGAGFKPDGNSGFPLMETCDIQAEDDVDGVPGRRLDALLAELRELATNGGTIPGVPIPISSEAEMNKILASAAEDKIGVIYKYEGDTTDTYEKGTLYILANEMSDGDEVSY